MMTPPDMSDRDSTLLTDGLYQLVDVLAYRRTLPQVQNLREGT